MLKNLRKGIMLNKIRQTSINRVNGKLVKFTLGDCLSIKVSNKFVGAIVTGKFNKYYNLTLIDNLSNSKLTIKEFENANFFGTHHGNWGKDLLYAVDQRMIECEYIDKEIDIEKTGNLDLIKNFVSAGYSYLSDKDEILEYYKGELQEREEKTENAKKFPELFFASKHLIEVNKIVLKTDSNSIVCKFRMSWFKKLFFN